jgi:hypothetical protein
MSIYVSKAAKPAFLKEQKQQDIGSSRRKERRTGSFGNKYCMMHMNRIPPN